jgi:hypothetical protein
MWRSAGGICVRVPLRVFGPIVGTPAEMPSGRPSSSGSRSASTVAWYGCRVFQRLLPERPTPERCVEAYYLQRTRFESIAERKLRRGS